MILKLVKLVIIIFFYTVVSAILFAKEILSKFLILINVLIIKQSDKIVLLYQPQNKKK